MNQKTQFNSSILDQVIGTKLNKFLAPQQNQGGLLNFVKSPYAGDIGMGLLAQSGYSTMPTSFGQSLGVAMNQANQLRSQRRADEIAELGTLVNLRGALQDPERKIIQGADGFQYYADTGERVLPNVKAPAPEFKAPRTEVVDGVLLTESEYGKGDFTAKTEKEKEFKAPRTQVIGDSLVTESSYGAGDFELVFEAKQNEKPDFQEFYPVGGGNPVQLNKNSPTFLKDVVGFRATNPINDYQSTTNGILHLPTMTFVEGTQQESDNFRILTPKEVEDQGLEKGKVYQINEKNNEIKGLNNGQTFNIGETTESKLAVELGKKRNNLVEQDQLKVSDWAKKGRAIQSIEAGLEDFQSGVYANARTFIGDFIRLVKPDAELSDYFGEGGAITQSGVNAFKRDLANGLQNLNIAELQMLDDILPSIFNTPYVNEVIIGAMKIDNKVSEQLDSLANDYFAGDIDFKQYKNKKTQLQKSAGKDLEDFFKSAKTLHTKLETEIKNLSGESTLAIDVLGNQKQITISPSDVWSGQYDYEGNPIIKTVDNDAYVVILE
jgi:hypothetical protein